MRNRFVCSVVTLVGFVGIVFAQSMPEQIVTLFSGLEPGGVTTEWEPLLFPRVDQRTTYVLVEDAGQVVLEATSRASASALLTRVQIDPMEYPHLNWSWKTEDACYSGDWRFSHLDDYPLRLFVVFESTGWMRSLFKRWGSDLAGDAIVYVAESSFSPRADPSSHLSDRIQVVPLVRPEAGDSKMVQEWRDVRADYRALFGREPLGVEAVAVMTDTDASQTDCVSHFGDIVFSDGSS